MLFLPFYLFYHFIISFSCTFVPALFLVYITNRSKVITFRVMFITFSVGITISVNLYYIYSWYYI